MLRAGQLRERITFQSKTLAPNQYHEQQETWTDLCSVNASVVPESAREAVAAQRLETQQGLNITVRYRDDITVKNRIKHIQSGSTRFYDVVSVTNRGLRNRVLDIVAVFEQDG